MKKIVLTLVLGLLISISAMAQSKNDKRATKATDRKIEKIEKTTKLSDSEKETFTELNKAFAIKHFSLREELKESDPAKYKEEVKANRADFNKKLTAALGKARAKEIIAASKVKKK
jgi:hypothetical protein